MKKGIYNILKGTFLISDDASKSWRMIIFLSLLALVMIASSHSADKKVYKIARLKNEVSAMRSIFIAGRSKLMKLKMESNVTSAMKNQGIVPSLVPPIKIVVSSKN